MTLLCCNGVNPVTCDSDDGLDNKFITLDGRPPPELMLRETSFLSEDDRATCQRLILLTANHQPSEQPLATEMLCCDLGILAADSPRYVEYIRQIKQEFQTVDPPVFQHGRRTVLQHFLDLAQQRRLFTAAFWPDTDHDRAIDNLSRELGALA